MFPRFSETFIVTEILAQEAAGLDLEIFSLRYPDDGRFHESLARVRSSVRYVARPHLDASQFWIELCEASKELPGLWPVLQEAQVEDVYDVYQAMLLSRQI